ncbi:MAG: hypothetical protein KJO45_03585 [Sulfurovum sp.]|nr:hypothetical protein [Sulfurovum sp.]
MNKLLMITLSILLFLLLTISGLSLFIFSPTGNNMLKPYVKEMLEEKIGLPVEIKTFTLESGTSNLDFVIDKQAVVNVESQYNLWSQSFEGLYHIKADTFAYEEITLKNADIKGNFKGVAEDIYVEGKGRALDAKVDYRLNVVDNEAQKILVNIQGAQLADVLQIYGYPALAEGKIDVEINMPDIGEDTASGYGHIVLDKAYFNRKLVKELYDYTLPEKSYVYGAIDAKLEGKNIKLLGDVQSNLFTLQTKSALVNMASKQLTAEYSVDVKDMRILTKNKLAGPLKVDGTVVMKDKKIGVTGVSHSLGGALRFTKKEATQITLEKLALEKILMLFKRPVYAKGEVSGTIELDKENKKDGTYALRIENGVLTSKAIEKMSRYQIPEKNAFSLESKGKVANKKLTANATLSSILADVTFTDLAYDLKEKTVISHYALLLHNMNALVPKAQMAKGTSASVEGELKFKDKLSISGVTKGLGNKLAFSYDSKTAKVDASQLVLEKILALSGVPVYAKGTFDSQIVLTKLKPSEGTFTLQATDLVTEPHEMKKLIGDALKVNIGVDTSGTFKEGTGYIDTKIKSSLGNITIDDMVVDPEKKTHKGIYTLDIPSLKALQKVLDQKLYGPLVLKGEWSKEKWLTVTGETGSLGGKIRSTLVEDNLRTTIDNVPLESILGMLGHKQDFLGKAFGKGKYNLKQRSGVMDLDIKSFQVKPSSTTNTIKMLIGKDPARVMFTSTKFHADIKGKITDYTLHAKGSRSSIDITEGRVNKINNTNTAKFKFVYEKYTVHGKIKGTIDDPKVTIDTSAILKDKIDEQLQEKIEKALGGKAGDFLRGLKF